MIVNVSNPPVAFKNASKITSVKIELGPRKRFFCEGGGVGGGAAFAQRDLVAIVILLNEELLVRERRLGSMGRKKARGFLCCSVNQIPDPSKKSLTNVVL